MTSPQCIQSERHYHSNVSLTVSISRMARVRVDRHRNAHIRLGVHPTIWSTLQTLQDPTNSVLAVLHRPLATRRQVHRREQYVCSRLAMYITDIIMLRHITL